MFQAYDLFEILRAEANYNLHHLSALRQTLNSILEQLTTQKHVCVKTWKSTLILSIFFHLILKSFLPSLSFFFYRSMSSLIARLQVNKALLSTKLAEAIQLMSQLQPSSSPVATVAGDTVSNGELIKQLKRENEQLRQEVTQCSNKLIELDARRAELFPISKESLPLPTPKVLKTSKVETAPVAAEESEATSTKQSIESKGKPKGKGQPGQTEAVPKPKKEKKAEMKATETPVNEKVDASRLKLLVGKIVDVQKHPDAEKLYVEQIELGEDRPRTIISGLVDYVPIEQMQDRLVVVLANLKPVKMRGILSEGMVMCASNKDANQVQPLRVPDGAVPGDRFEFAQYPGQPDDLLNPKKKIFEQVSPDLITDANGVATYKGDPFSLPGKGVAVAPNMPNVPVR